MGFTMRRFGRALPRICLAGAVFCFAAWPAAGQDKKTLEVNGATIAYQDVGQGEPLVLLHGFGETGGTWDPVVEELGQAYRLIIPDLRGHGQSINPLPYFTHRDASADILALLRELNVGSVRAMGFSSGGMTLLHMATSAPGQVSVMVLVGSAPYLPEQARGIMRSMNPDVMPMAQLEAMGLVHGDTAQARRLLKQFIGFQDSYDDVNFTRPLLSTITARTLVVHGDRDPFFSVDVASELFSSIPDANLLVFPGQGHLPFPEDMSGRQYFLRAVLQFLGGPPE